MRQRRAGCVLGISLPGNSFLAKRLGRVVSAAPVAERKPVCGICGDQMEKIHEHVNAKAAEKTAHMQMHAA